MKNKPGTNLKKLLGWFKFKPVQGCDCERYAEEMDNRGVDWCKDHIPEIVDQLRKESTRRNIPFFEFAAKAFIHEAIKESEHGVTQMEKVQESEIIREIETLRGPSIERMVGWENLPSVKEAHRRLFNEVAVTNFEYPGGFEGDGIITLGGSKKYFVAAYVMIRRLQDLGCKLPIELWYLNPSELDHRMRNLMSGIGVVCVDMSNIEMRRRGGWEAKIYAILNCRFRRVLFLDSDNYPNRDPSYLFEDPRFVDTGAFFWPDLLNVHGYDITKDAFEIAGISVPGNSRIPNHNKPTDYRPLESGQILVDKSKVWRALQVTKHINDHSDFWFGSPAGRKTWWIYGDKSTFYLAFNRTETRYEVPPDCTWFGDQMAGGFQQHDMDGNPLFQHRCQPTYKVRIDIKNSTAGLADPEKFTSFVDELKSKWSGVVWNWNDQSPEDHAEAKKLFGDWFGCGLPFGRVTFLDGGKMTDRRYHWRILHHEGKPYLCLADDNAAFGFLGQDENHKCWINNDFYLMHAAPQDWNSRWRHFEVSVWQDIVHNNEYKLPDIFDPNDKIIDVGSHEGSFCYACLTRHAGTVFSFEPNQESFVNLWRNMQKYADRWQGVNAACWRSDRIDRWMNLNTMAGALHSGGYAVQNDGSEGQLIRTASLDPVIDFMKEIRLLKLDCEGAEWPILFTCTNLDKVKAICAEYHLAWVDHYDEKWKLGLPEFNIENVKHLLENRWGFKFVSIENPLDAKIGHFWAWRDGFEFKGLSIL